MIDKLGKIQVPLINVLLFAFLGYIVYVLYLEVKKGDDEK